MGIFVLTFSSYQRKPINLFGAYVTDTRLCTVLYPPRKYSLQMYKCAYYPIDAREAQYQIILIVLYLG